MSSEAGKATNFLFTRDFGAGQAAPSPKQQQALTEAEQRGYARGLAEGRAKAEAETAARLNECLKRIGEAAAKLLAGAEAHGAALEQEAIAFAMAFAHKLAGDALARYPLAAIEQVARTSFEHLRGVPHLVVRVNDDLVEGVDALVKRIARERGFEGRLVIMGEPDIRPGDARFEWADGGIVRDGARMGESLARSLSAA